MIKSVRDEPFSPHDGNGALSRDDPRKLVHGSAHDLRSRTGHDARHESKRPQRLLGTERPRRQRELAHERRVRGQLRHARQRARIGRQPDVHLLDAERGVRRRPAHVDGAQQVERQSERRAVHGRYHWLRDARRCADRVLEVAEVGAR